MSTAFADELRAIHEPDLLHGVAVSELLRARGWRPSGDFHVPPKQPRR